MKHHDSYTDDSGQRWEMLYEERMHIARDEATGELVTLPSEIVELRYRKEGEDEWLALPPWATVAQGAAITLCFFDEDEDTDDLTFWSVTSKSETSTEDTA